MKTAIDKGWLVSFRYYGVYDETDYSTIDFKNGKYDEKELEKVLMIHQRAELIFKHYEKYKSKRAIDIPFFLTGNIKDYGKKGKGYSPEEEEYPEDCIINVALNVVDIFKKQAEAFTKRRILQN